MCVLRELSSMSCEATADHMVYTDERLAQRRGQCLRSVGADGETPANPGPACVSNAIQLGRGYAG